MFSFMQIAKFLLIWTLVLLAGCSRGDVEPLREESVYHDEVYLNISLDIDNGAGQSRANRPEDEETLVNGTGNENAINSLQLFWKENGEWRMLEIDAQELANITNGGGIKIALDKDDYPELEHEGIEMWLGANLSREQANAFMTADGDTDGIYTLQSTTDWAGELAPMYSDFSGRGDIAMFCKESGTTKLATTSQDDEYSISFRLKRLVAKVLVACKADAQGYANTPDEPNTTYY